MDVVALVTLESREGLRLPPIALLRMSLPASFALRLLLAPSRLPPRHELLSDTGIFFAPGTPTRPAATQMPKPCDRVCCAAD